MHTKLTALTAIAIAVAAAPGASAAIPVEMRGEPVGKPTGQSSSQSRNVQDLRSPDTREAAASSQLAQSRKVQDLRSPDTREAAASSQVAADLARSASMTTYRPTPATAPTVSSTPQPTGPGWDTVGLAIGGALGLALLTMVGASRIRRRSSTKRMSTAIG